MLLNDYLKCVNCKSNRTVLICRKFTRCNKQYVRFDVECNACGTWSHLIKRNEVNVAVEKMLDDIAKAN